MWPSFSVRPVDVVLVAGDDVADRAVARRRTRRSGRRTSGGLAACRVSAVSARACSAGVTPGVPLRSIGFVGSYGFGRADRRRRDGGARRRCAGVVGVGRRSVWSSGAGHGAIAPRPSPACSRVRHRLSCRSRRPASSSSSTCRARFVLRRLGFARCRRGRRCFRRIRRRACVVLGRRSRFRSPPEQARGEHDRTRRRRRPEFGPFSNASSRFARFEPTPRGPAWRRAGVKVRDDRGLGGIGRQVSQLVRIVDEIEQLLVAVGIFDVLVRRGAQAPVHAHRGSVVPAAGRVGLRLARAATPEQHLGREGRPGRRPARWRPTKRRRRIRSAGSSWPREECGNEIDVAREPGCRSGDDARPSHHERHANGFLEEIAFAGEAVLAEVVAVVRR